jgi:hypothetical protein
MQAVLVTSTLAGELLGVQVAHDAIPKMGEV